MSASPPQRSSARRRSQHELAARARAIRLAVFDVDGVMTDGRIYLGASGEEMKAFNVLDGHGLKLLREQGIEVAILSGRRAGCVDRRAVELGIRHVVQGAGEKLPAFLQLITKLDVQARDTCYMGDDVMDLPVLEACGLAFSVPDAPHEVRRAAHHVTRRRGGEGAVREACERLLELRARIGAAGRGEG
ncbi:MAG: HAD-IIIA family hydrolase [Burkholderiales bacterium]|nr:HAD-IIIA family hydrolase [Burkholderiales bacterium]